MEYRENGTRYKNYKKWCVLKNNPYDYENDGLIKHLMSHNITSTNNHVLRVILTYFEKTLVYLLKYVDILKNFKNYHWKNR